MHYAGKPAGTAECELCIAIAVTYCNYVWTQTYTHKPKSHDTVSEHILCPSEAAIRDTHIGFVQHGPVA
jgi:hypothetical protein